MITNKPLSVPRNGLIAEFLLDGNALDTNDGTKNNGTATNVSYSDTKIGYQKQGGNFDGSSSYVSSTMPSVSGSSFSIEVTCSWNSTAGFPGLLGIGNSTTPSNSAGILYLTGMGMIRFGFYANDLDLPFTPTLGQKYHIVCTYDTVTNVREIFIDGQSIGSGVSSGDFTGTGDIVIGRYYSGLSQNYHNGFVQTVRFYNRVISAKEILLFSTESKRMLGNDGQPDVMSKIGYQFESFGDNALWETLAGTVVTRTGGTAGTDDLGMARSITNPNYSWSSLSYVAAYSWENSGSGWNLAKNPAGVSATGINRTTNFRQLFLSSEALTADEEAQLAKLCSYSYPVRFSKKLTGSLNQGVLMDLENSYDQSGNGKNGTDSNSPATVRRSLAVGRKYNGTNQSTSFPTLTKTAYTWAVWVKPNSVPSGSNKDVLTFDNSAGTASYVSYTHDNSNSAYRNTHWVLTSGSTIHYAALTAAPPTDRYSLIVGTYDGQTNGEIAIWRNGCKIASTNITGTVATTYGGHIGGLPAASTFTDCETVRQTVWGRKLSDEEQQALFHTTYLQ